MLYIKKKSFFNFKPAVFQHLNVSFFVYYETKRKAAFECLLYATYYFAYICHVPSYFFLCQQFKLFPFLFHMRVCPGLLNGFSMAFSKSFLLCGIFYCDSDLYRRQSCTIYLAEDPYSTFYILYAAFCWKFLFDFSCFNQNWMVS